MERRAYVVGVIASAGIFSLAGAQQPLNPETANEPRISVAVQRGHLTASIENSPLHAVLEELSARTQIALVAGEGLEGDYVSAELKNVPVDEGLRDILKNHDAFYYYGAVGQNTKPSLRAVWVYPKGTAATFQPVPPGAWASTKDLQASLADNDPAVRERAYEALMSRPDKESANLILLALRGASETDPGNATTTPVERAQQGHRCTARVACRPGAKRCLRGNPHDGADRITR